MKSKSMLRRIEQLEKKIIPPKRGGKIMVIVRAGETVDHKQYEGYDEVMFILEDELED